MSSPTLEEVCAAAVIIHASLQSARKQQRKRREWMSQLFKRRELEGGGLMADLSLTQFQNFCRMTLTDFENLLKLIEPQISKRNTTFRQCIPARTRLAVTLRYLATGDSFISLSYLFKISKQSVSRSVFDVCTNIIKALNNYVKVSDKICVVYFYNIYYFRLSVSLIYSLTHSLSHSLSVAPFPLQTKDL